MVVEALLDEAGFEDFREWAEKEPLILDRYRGEQTQGWAFGAPYQTDVWVRVEFELQEGRLEVCRSSIRVMMTDLVNSIRDREYLTAVTLEEALASIAVAHAATAAP